LDEDVVVGRGTHVGNNVTIIRSVIGAGCNIADNVTIQDSYLLDNVVVKADCHVKLCVLGEAVQLSSACNLVNALLESGVLLPPNTDLRDKVITNQNTGKLKKKMRVLYFLVEANQDGASKRDRGSLRAAHVRDWSVATWASLILVPSWLSSTISARNY